MTDTNSGDRNSGDDNSGDWNSGNCNSGYFNSGDRNSGDWNSGNWNSGDYNSGGRNSGGRNSGYYNSGGRNLGNWNSGGWNSCDKETGYFNSIQSDTIRVFNKPCLLSDWENAKKPNFIYFSLIEWISEEAMTDEEKENNPSYKTIQGYLKTYTYQEAWANAWVQATKEDKQLLYTLPNFNSEVFKEITGIDVNPEEKKTVTLELTDEQLEQIKTILDN